jgi:hypothetical protein
MNIKKLLLPVVLIILLAGVFFYYFNPEPKDLEEQNFNKLEIGLIEHGIDYFLNSKINKVKSEPPDESDSNSTDQQTFSGEVLNKINSSTTKEDTKKLIAQDDIKSISPLVAAYNNILIRKDDKDFKAYFKNKSKDFLKLHGRTDLNSQLPQMFDEYILHETNYKKGLEIKIENAKKVLK